MLTKFETIELYRGGASIVAIDMTEFEYSGGSVDFVIEDSDGAQIFAHRMTEQQEYLITIPYEVTAGMSIGRHQYHYGLTKNAYGQRFPLCLASDVNVSRVAETVYTEAGDD